MIQNKFLKLDLQYFAADTGAAAGGDAGAAAGDTGTAGAGDNNAAAGGTDTSATGDNTAGGGDTGEGSGSKLSAEDLKRYEESEFLKALGVDSIEDVKAALAAAKQLDDTKQADDKTQATDEPPGDKKEDPPGDTKADDKTGDQKADETPPETKEPDQKAEPTVEEKEQEIADLKAQLAAAKNGVPEDNLDDVIVLAKALSTKGEGMEIDAAIKEVLKKYPSFAGAATPPADRPRFGEAGSQRQADETDPFVKTLLGR